MPNYGDKQTVPCSWCGRMVTEVWSHYPPDTGIPGGFWDCSACPCGSIAGMIAYANASGMAGRTNAFRRNRDMLITKPELR
jgi:hypothetical protein